MKIIGNLIVFFFLILFIELSSAGSIGVSPSSFSFDFRPNLKENLNIRVSSSDMNQKIEMYVTGDLIEYVNLSKKEFIGASDIQISINLPSSLEKPGKHRIIVGAREKRDSFQQSGIIGGISAVQVPIDIFVPYPGKYLEAEFEIESVNEGEDIPYKLVIINFGTERVDYSYSIEIFADYLNSSLINISGSGYLDNGIRRKIEDKIKEHNLKPGNYFAVAKVLYEEEIVINKSFRIGTFFINITDYDYQFISGKINPFNMELESFWNSFIEDVFFIVSVSENGSIKSIFRSQNYRFEPMQKMKVLGYIDANNITEGKYLANIILNYGNVSSSKLVYFYFKKPERSLVERIFYLVIVLLVIFLIIILFLIVKLKLRRKNNENKKR